MLWSCLFHSRSFSLLCAWLVFVGEEANRKGRKQVNQIRKQTRSNNGAKRRENFRTAFFDGTRSARLGTKQSGWCPGEAWGLGGSSAAQARVGKGPRCTPYAVPVPASSARSDRPIPHRSHGIKHPLTNAGPSLKRTRTPSCTNHSDDRARAHWPTAPRAVGKHRGDDRRGLGRQPNDQHRAVPPLIHRAPETPRR